MEHFVGTFKKYADFKGRARRKEYWMFILFYLIIIIGLSIVDYTIGTGFLSSIFSLVMFVPSLSIAARRLHDTGRTGWWQLIYLVPLVGLIVMLIFLTQDSHDANDYGQNPKTAETNDAELA
ncbi:DUF805 domain-containing protein [Pseudocolwellia agarivorans]|uniref:DUF805 domain-containing protein n=1 Tax=Pseudocolwellia agarivorans TaxID=1911682 RepID=UPI000985E585|nr:DUF805 domain-containing protein [Pseudocolwellia agarivorans]